MKETRTAIGRVRMAISAERKWNRKTMMTRLTMMASSSRSRCKRLMESLNQPGAVISGDDLNSRRQRGRNLAELLLYAVDDIQRIHALTHDDDAADGFAFAVPLGDPFANIRAEATRCRDRAASTGVPFLLPTATVARSSSERR